jgi:hypothetical protein
MNDKRKSAAKPRTKAAEMAGATLDQRADLSASFEQREKRKQRLLKGPTEFRDLRRARRSKD